MAPMIYQEELPDQCPPAIALDVAMSTIYRVVSKIEPGKEDFLSYSALNKPRPSTVTECRWASCSLFSNKDTALAIAKKLPKPRYEKPYLATLDIAAGDGKSIQNSKSSHIDFWMSSVFNSEASITKVEKIDVS
jgi:hypothetical protein